MNHTRRHREALGRTRAQATWPDPSGRSEAARVGCAPPSLQGALAAGRVGTRARPPQPRGIPGMLGSAPAPRELPGGTGREPRVPTRRGPRPFLRGRAARHPWAGGRRDHVRRERRAGVTGRPRPRSRPPVQPVLPAPPAAAGRPPPPELRARGGGAGRGAGGGAAP